MPLNMQKAHLYLGLENLMVSALLYYFKNVVLESNYQWNFGASVV